MMPRYFFTIDSEPDIVGLELPDRHSVRSEAIKAAGEILRDIDGALEGQEWTMIVTDENGDPVLELRFSVVERGAA